MESYCRVTQVRDFLMKCRALVNHRRPAKIALPARQYMLMLSAVSVLLQSNAGTMQNINGLYIPIKTLLLVDIRWIPFVHITALWLVLVPCTLSPHTQQLLRRDQNKNPVLLLKTFWNVSGLSLYLRELYEQNRRLQSCISVLTLRLLMSYIYIYIYIWSS